MLNEFPILISNQKADGYGGSVEGTVKVVVEVCKAIRKVAPKGLPIFLRVSATEWMDDGEIGRELWTWDVGRGMWDVGSSLRARHRSAGRQLWRQG